MTTKYNNCETQKYCGVYRVLANENKKIRHDTLLITIRDEFEEEISLQKIMESNYVNSRGEIYQMNEKEKMIWI